MSILLVSAITAVTITAAALVATVVILLEIIISSLYRLIKNDWL